MTIDEHLRLAKWLKNGEAALLGRLPQSPRAWGKDAGSFFAHGHRLSSLYRAVRKAPNPFFVLKILRILRVLTGTGSEYLRSKEARRVPV